MTLNTRTIISATERMLTLAKMAQVSDDRDTRRNAILGTFGQMATDLGKVIERYKPTDWNAVLTYVDVLHTAACQTEETRTGPCVHVGAQTALTGSLVALAHVLGFTIADASTARIDTTPEDESARRYAEGHETREAAE